MIDLSRCCRGHARLLERPEEDEVRPVAVTIAATVAAEEKGQPAERVPADGRRNHERDDGAANSHVPSHRTGVAVRVAEYHQCDRRERSFGDQYPTRFDLIDGASETIAPAWRVPSGTPFLARFVVESTSPIISPIRDNPSNLWPRRVTNRIVKLSVPRGPIDSSSRATLAKCTVIGGFQRDGCRLRADGRICHARQRKVSQQPP